MRSFQTRFLCFDNKHLVPLFNKHHRAANNTRNSRTKIVAIARTQTRTRSATASWNHAASIEIENQRSNEEVFSVPLSPGSTFHNDDHSDDLILQTAPIQSSNISSLRA